MEDENRSKRANYKNFKLFFEKSKMVCFLNIENRVGVIRQSEMCLGNVDKMLGTVSLPYSCYTSGW
jgi:hypothetical protein